MRVMLLKLDEFLAEEIILDSKTVVALGLCFCLYLGLDVTSDSI